MKKNSIEMISLSERLAESQKLRQSFSGKVPVIIERQENTKNNYNLPNNKFLVPKWFTFHEFLYLLRQKLNLKKQEALYVTVGNGTFPTMNRSFNSIYEEFKNPDGFLYIIYSSEAIWG